MLVHTERNILGPTYTQDQIILYMSKIELCPPALMSWSILYQIQKSMTVLEFSSIKKLSPHLEVIYIRIHLQSHPFQEIHPS